ncbi:PTS sugar transporter subunit IIA [Listeria monocytogenes]|nr:PTS sugar transporter subunit IIA [Listeria monocytogenes]
MLPITLEQIELDVEVESPIDAIRAAGNLLVKTESALSRYVDAMVAGYEKLGPYIVLAPHIAIPHARPEHGVKKQCMSIVRLKKPIKFGHPTNDDVSLVIAIGGVDTNFHIKMLQALSELLTDEDKLKILKTSTDKLEILCTINKEEK